MDHALSARSVPSFVETTREQSRARGLGPVTPGELYCALFLEGQERMGYLGPAFEFARDALERAEVPQVFAASDVVPIQQLVDWAVADLEPLSDQNFGSSWPRRVVREFAPTGLADGAWFGAGFLAQHAERADALGQALRTQVRWRACAGPGAASHARNYAALLSSLGVPSHASSRWDFDDTPACADISYEHALLGLTLGMCSAAFACEIFGFNLWMAAVGPCPLLAGLREELELRGAAIDYLEHGRRSLLRELAETSLEGILVDTETGTRAVRGFFAAHHSYRRWEAAIRGANVPYTAKDFVLEGIRRKARFAIDHHHDVSLKGHNLAELLREGGRAHELLLEHLAESASLIRKGAPDRSPFMIHTLSLDGPMFDAFTAEEKNDLREWIASLGQPQTSNRQAPAPIGLSGRYTAIADDASLSAHYATLYMRELNCCVRDPERHPGARLEVRGRLERFFAQLPALLSAQAQGSEQAPPTYSTQGLVELVASNRGVLPDMYRERAWLRGTLDVSRVDSEEYGYLLARYLQSADGAGSTQLAESALQLNGWTFLREGLAANTRAFLPEILGINLAFEPSAAEPEEHSSILHRRWALSAVQAFMERVKDACPGDVPRQWQRVWWAHRLGQILVFGGAAEPHVQETLERALTPATPQRARDEGASV